MPVKPRGLRAKNRLLTSAYALLSEANDRLTLANKAMGEAKANADRAAAVLGFAEARKMHANRVADLEAEIARRINDQSAAAATYAQNWMSSDTQCEKTEHDVARREANSLLAERARFAQAEAELLQSIAALEGDVLQMALSEKSGQDRVATLEEVLRDVRGEHEQACKREALLRDDVALYESNKQEREAVNQRLRVTIDELTAEFEHRQRKLEVEMCRAKEAYLMGDTGLVY